MHSVGCGGVCVCGGGGGGGGAGRGGGQRGRAEGAGRGGGRGGVVIIRESIPTHYCIQGMEAYGNQLPEKVEFVIQQPITSKEDQITLVPARLNGIENPHISHAPPPCFKW